MVYILLLLILLMLLTIGNYFDNMLVKITPFIFLGLFSGFRYNVGVDYFSYQSLYSRILSGTYSHTEIGYNSLVLLVNLIGSLTNVVKSK